MNVQLSLFDDVQPIASDNVSDLELENNMAVGTGNFLAKIWFESTEDGARLPDFVQAFTSRKEALESTNFLKEMKGVDACYIVRLKPYGLIERVIRFPSDR